jgi:hypothetical protein
MLPGFRFLFAAIVLSMSAMVFGLGAASLFRAAHEEFASLPSRRVPPETVFAPQNEAPPPALAMLRVEAPVADQAADKVLPPAVAIEQPATVLAPAEPEKSAALKPENSSEPPETANFETAKSETSKSETAKSEIPVAETPPQDEAAPASADKPVSTEETSIAATEPAPPLSQAAAPAASEQASAPALPEAELPSTATAAKIATLGGPPVAIETAPPAKADDEENGIQKRQHARRAAHRRKMAARARLARQMVQQPADVSSQPTVAVRNPAVAGRNR